MTIAISSLATAAITAGLLLICLGIVIFAGAVNQATRRKIAERDKAARR